MCNDSTHLTLTIINVVTGLGMVGTWSLIAHAVRNDPAGFFVKPVLGWFFGSAWVFSSIMPFSKAGTSMSDWAALALCFLITVAPAFPFGFAVEWWWKKKGWVCE